MAVSIPVLAFLNKDNDRHQLIKEARCEYSACSDDAAKAAGIVKKMFNERAAIQQFGRNGYSYVAAHFSRNARIDAIERCIR